jgi:hypothetical protein
VEIWALQYFADLTIDKVTEAKLADYVHWRLSQPRRPAIVTPGNVFGNQEHLGASAARRQPWAESKRMLGSR